ncbi:hypothetical protein EUGRSUZ_B02062 [Eucalyptus grandis]|uniref:Uncharacterized protein n=2 Tax=Eucalyptus grandis TaxID=71139 RepID=A0ACC3M2U6_EUCGR|nr:hypothetical protein EUGRSUZ_B02062 [Eucalyptus grandis]
MTATGKPLGSLKSVTGVGRKRLRKRLLFLTFSACGIRLSGRGAALPLTFTHKTHAPIPSQIVDHLSQFIPPPCTLPVLSPSLSFFLSIHVYSLGRMFNVWPPSVPPPLGEDAGPHDVFEGQKREDAADRLVWQRADEIASFGGIRPVAGGFAADGAASVADGRAMLAGRRKAAGGGAAGVADGDQRGTGGSGDGDGRAVLTGRRESTGRGAAAGVGSSGGECRGRRGARLHEEGDLCFFVFLLSFFLSHTSPLSAHIQTNSKGNPFC